MRTRLLAMAFVLLAAVPGLRAEDEPITDSRLEEVTPEPESPLSGLARRAFEELDDDDVEACNTMPRLVINELCAVGVECDEDVRIGDYVELFNPSNGTAALSCYVLVNAEEIAFFPSGVLASRAIRAWGEKDLGFRIAKKGDRVVLFQVGLDLGGTPTLRELDARGVDASEAHAIRVPDGGRWRVRSIHDAEWQWPGSFGESNRDSK